MDIKQYQREYYLKNKERKHAAKLEYMKEYRLKNRDRINAHIKEYRKKRKELAC